MKKIVVNVQTGEQNIVDMTAAEVEQLQGSIEQRTYADLRRAEYPPIGDQLDALWKGGVDAEAIKQHIAVVKAKYPKP